MQFDHFYFFSHIPGLRHAITTRHGGVSKSSFTSLNLAFHVDDDPMVVQKNRRLLAKGAEFDVETLVAAQQVHGDQTYIVKTEDAGRGALDGESAVPDVDALITAHENIPLLIQIADCAPVFLADADAHVLGAAHAGWRGAAAGIAGKTMQRMTELAAEPKSTFAGIGPCLCTKCLEIGEEVADLITPIYPEVIQIISKKLHLNLREMIRQNLIETGLKADHIEAMHECPRCDTKKYFSHRGENGNTGRFGLVAWWES